MEHLKSRPFLPFNKTVLDQYLKEDTQQQSFENISTYAAYFGEKQAMLKAFFDFFMVWLIIPSVFCVMMSIYQWTRPNSMDSMLTLLYTLLITLWGTLLAERWKRKEYQIAYKWGYNLTKIHDNVDFRIN